MAQTAEIMVVDASVAVKWHLQDEEYVSQADLLLERFIHGQTHLVAPDHIRYEVPSALVVASRRKDLRIGPEQAQEALEEFLALGLSTFGSDDLIVAALPLVWQYDIAFYDGLYLAVAQQYNLPFITADRRLYARINHIPSVIWIGDYA